MADIAGYFNQHCVPIYFILENEKNEMHNYIVSAFVLSIGDDWFLITAGHCLEKLNEFEKQGFKVAKTRLVDYTGTQSSHKLPIPFDFENSTKVFLDKNKYDYGVIFLNQNYRSLLEANGINPFDESVWSQQPSVADFYFLLGVPEELTEEKDGNVLISPTFHPVEESVEAEKAFEQSDCPRFFGKVKLQNYGIENIEGMSGGPVISFQRSDDGKLKYWLCAVQSRWLPTKKYIAACKIKPFAEAIRDAIQENS